MRYKILSVFAALATITACGDLTSINSNPNGPTDVDPPSILGNALDNVAGGVNGVNSLNIRGGGLWVQYYAEIQYRDEDKYILRSGSSGGWGFYNSSLEDFQRMIEKGVAAGRPNWSAVGRIMKSYVFSVMTDAMGDLPYSQALKGDTVLQPAYDTQQAIYNGLFADLTLATTELDASGTATSMWITWPACGDSNPNSRAIRSMRSGSRSEASSKRRARFISIRPSRCDFSASILYPYSMALKCWKA